MQRYFKKLLCTIGASTLAIGVFAGAPAYASTESAPQSTGDGEPDQIIYINGPLPENNRSQKIIQSDRNAEVTIVEQADLPVVPEPGETVRLVYTNAVTEITTEPAAASSVGIAAACTRSITASTPVRTSYPSARAYGQGSISSGCSSGSTLRVYLYTGWDVRANNSLFVTNNGSTWGTSTTATCGNSNSTSHYTLSTWSSGGSARSQSVSLFCGYGFWG